MPQTSVLDHAYELLAEYFVINSHSIAFPELVLPTIVEVGGVGGVGPVGWVGWGLWDGWGGVHGVGGVFVMPPYHVLQLNKVAKETHFSWFKRQIKQLVDKVGMVLCVCGRGSLCVCVCVCVWSSV